MVIPTNAILREIKSDPIIGSLITGVGIAAAFGHGFGRAFAQDHDLRIVHHALSKPGLQFTTEDFSTVKRNPELLRKPLEKAKLHFARRYDEFANNAPFKKFDAATRDLLQNSKFQKTELATFEAIVNDLSPAGKPIWKRFLKSTATYKVTGALLMAAGIGLTIYEFYNSRHSAKF